MVASNWMFALRIAALAARGSAISDVEILLLSRFYSRNHFSTSGDRDARFQTYGIPERSSRPHQWCNRLIRWEQEGAEERQRSGCCGLAWSVCALYHSLALCRAVRCRRWW
ncbi:hypothetical protein F2Q69_00024715 [Brassica cretica]|uniref:Secreted protein n=1 Tax=Brassica cretica TaxID=69181 RepID=A0A8S9Q6P2_BRACR|nr:hypothetical protein F2Q69_00024715 [Brassica cretica]